MSGEPTGQLVWEPGVRDPGRLAALAVSGLVGTGPEDAFDRLTELAATVIGAPQAFVTLVDAERYRFKSAVGLADGAPQHGLVEQSFCRYVVGSGRPLVVEDAANDPRTSDDPAVELLGVAAWAGFPVVGPTGEVLGTFCVVASSPRRWSDCDVHVLATLAAAASSEIALVVLRRELDVLRVTAGSMHAAGGGADGQPHRRGLRQAVLRLLRVPRP
ncbi:MAG: GAF domain-containing protein [Acidimicrobiales bacterium]